MTSTPDDANVRHLVERKEGVRNRSMQREWRNSYVGVRHGISEANERGVIVATAENGLSGWGLSARGAEECRARFQLARPNGGAAQREWLVVTSDFRRAIETAAILCETLEIPEWSIDTDLRERRFGALELGSADRYEAVWARDRAGLPPHVAGVESPSAVATRMLAVMERLDIAFTNRTILLVSHGDPLQILATVLQGKPADRHREQRAWENAELRCLVR